MTKMVPSATVFFCFCVLAVYSIDGDESRRFKRDVVSGLVSFPRIGRSDHLWKIGSQEVKRQSLVSFPRTGKRDATDGTDPDSLSDVLWLGPERREIMNGKIWALVQMKDIPSLTGRPGREGYLRRSSGEPTDEAG